jgi:hypothetical protein
MPWLPALILLFACALGLPARADFVPFNGSEVADNIAIIHVGEAGVTIELEVFVGDLQLFEDLLPNSWIPGDAPARISEPERWARFSKSGISIVRGDGAALPMRVELIEPRQRVDRASPMAGQTDPFTGQLVPAPPADSRVAFARLFYDFNGDRPESLTMRAPSGDEAEAAVIGMLVYDRGVPVTDFRFLAGGATLNIDWVDPWFSRFDAKTLNRRNQTNASTYLYLEPKEVRHESLIRLRDFAPWIGREFKAGAILSADEQDEIESAAAEFLAGRNPVTIDGVRTEPTRAYADLLEIDVRGYQIINEDAPLNVNAAFVGVILSFPVSGLPDAVKVDWDMFDSRITKIAATSIDPAGPFIGGASPDDPEFSWTNHLLTYVHPQVASIPAPNSIVRLPVVAILAGLVGLIALVICVRASGRAARLSALGAAVVAGGVAVYNSDVVAEIPNPIAPQPDEAMAQPVLSAMIDNFAAVGIEITPKARAVAIAPVVSEASHADISAEIERGLAIRVPGGGLAQVDEVSDLRVDDLTPLSDGYGFQTLASWRVIASAGHWGHSHRRIVEYRALMEVFVEDGEWKLKGLTILEARTPNA